MRRRAFWRYMQIGGKNLRIITIATLAFGLAAPVLAQEGAGLAVGESEQFGQYLTDAAGRPVVLFTADTQGAEGQDPAIACEGECAEAWPPVTSSGMPELGDEVDQSLVGTFQDGEAQVVTYNGWPLYYFARDAGADAPQGQDVESFGGEWYLVTPAGEKVEEAE